MPKYVVLKNGIIFDGEIKGTGVGFDAEPHQVEQFLERGVVGLAPDAPPVPVAEVELPQEVADAAPAEPPAFIVPEPEPAKPVVSVAKGLGRPPKQK